MGLGTLAQVVRPLAESFRPADHPDLLVGLAGPDDAAVWRINDDVAVVQTLDFFPPVVDDPYVFGAVAAANAMSDVYAMGGEVVLALNICGFPPIYRLMSSLRSCYTPETSGGLQHRCPIRREAGGANHPLQHRGPGALDDWRSGGGGRRGRGSLRKAV